MSQNASEERDVGSRGAYTNVHGITYLGDEESVQYISSRDIPCPSCGFNLRGIAKVICPECGCQVGLSFGPSICGRRRHGGWALCLVSAAVAATNGLSTTALLVHSLATVGVLPSSPLEWWQFGLLGVFAASLACVGVAVVLMCCREWFVTRSVAVQSGFAAITLAIAMLSFLI